jgi:outer membrane protein, heavy metal efflux system
MLIRDLQRTPRPRRTLRVALVVGLLMATRSANGQESGGTTFSLPTDPVLARLIEESLAARPELRQAEELVHAERQRVPQAGALPDPVLSLGIQNDGFSGIQVGKMETSYYQVMVSQGLPWPGKRGLRTDVAALTADQAGTTVARGRLATEAEVRRAYLDLLLVRDRLELLGHLETIWRKSSGVAQVRYETGEGAQSDLLRAQLEQNRLKQRRWALQADERTRIQALNRLRGHPLDEPIVTTVGVRDLGVPAQLDPEAAFAEAAARSPELAQARIGVAIAEKGVALARRERFPDLSVSAGIMPRGALEPMWQAGISLNLPLWSVRKQGRAIEENQARAAAGALGAAAVEQVLRLRVAERRAALASVLESIDLYRNGLLVQSQATAESTLTQFRVGRVTFASVLEANAGYIGDEEGYLGTLAEAQRIAIASAEVSLDPRGSALGAGGLGGAAMPGAGAMGGGASPSAPGGGAAPAASGGAPSSM